MPPSYSFEENKPMPFHDKCDVHTWVLVISMQTWSTKQVTGQLGLL